MQEIRPYRSVLYIPGSNARALEKAQSLKADAFIFDLEDAVAPDAKAEAREAVARALANFNYGAREVFVRVNGLDTGLFGADVAVACAARPAGILVPKISSPADVRRAGAVIAQHRAAPSLKFWGMMETPLGFLNAKEIALGAETAPVPLSGLVIGTNDLAKELRCDQTPMREALIPPLMWALMAARAAEMTIIDGVFNDIQDEERFAAACCQGAEMGFDGKTLIHPTQIDPCNRIFAPLPEQVEAAMRIIQAFDDPANRTVGALKIDGRMVERLHAEEARRLVAIAKAIEQLEANDG